MMVSYNINHFRTHLRYRRALFVLAGLFCGFLGGCATLKDTRPDPSDRNAKNQVWTYDCCDPGLSAGTKEMCKWAADTKDHILRDTDGNEYRFIWSDCKVGKEPWREWEKSNLYKRNQ